MLDCSIVKCASQTQSSLNLISSTDYFYPLVDDPYIQGRIGATNVISDVYSLGIANIDNILMILAASSNIEQKEHRDIITSEMMRGFIDTCSLADTRVTGGHSVRNPWPIIGGCAQAVVSDDDYISPYNGQRGDYLVLTKPLGTQVTVNVAEWKSLNNDRYKTLISEGILDDVALDTMTNIGKGSMMKLNRNAATLMVSDRYKEYVNGATDVTGFGLLGHARNLSIHQHANTKSNGRDGIKLVIDRMPIIQHTDIVNERFNGMFKLDSGLSAETSGGLMIMIRDKKVAEDFVEELSEMDGWPSWIIGQVVECEYPDGLTMDKAAMIDSDCEFVNVWG